MTPSLSVVVVTRDDHRTLRPILASLAGQTVASDLEVVIVAPDESRGTPPASELDAFGSWRVVPVGTVTNRGRAAAAGVLSARAPLVALSENHCFPDPDWAACTIEAHARGRRDAVGPAILNANPERPLSRLLHAAGYGPYPADAPPGPRTELPLHNSSYRREAIESHAGELEDLLADERRLQARLVAEGRVLWFEPGCRKRHLSEATWDLLLGLGLDAGRRYGGARARDWTPARRWAYGLATPLLSVPIAHHVWSLLPPSERGVRMGALAFVYGFLHAIGEGLSYLGGEKEEFPFVEEDEFLIRERLGGHPLADPRIRDLVARLDR